MKKMENVLLLMFLSVFFPPAYGQQCETHFSRNVKIATGEVYFNSPVLEHVSFLKAVRPEFTGYYLSIKSSGRFSRIRPKGAVILLGDGTRINRPSYRVEKQMDSCHTFGEGKYQFSAFLPLSADETTRIALVGIANFKLSVYEYSLSLTQQSLVKERAACMLSIK